MILTNPHLYPGQSILHKNIPIFYTKYLPLNYGDKFSLLVKERPN
jgi:hypothetical protein